MTGNPEMVSDRVREATQGVLVKPISRSEFQRAFDCLSLRVIDKSDLVAA
ncbi:hypothetical protein [Azospirillum doebereinerae]